MKKLIIFVILLFAITSCNDDEVAVKNIYNENANAIAVQYELDHDSTIIYNQNYPIYRKNSVDYVINENKQIVARYGVNDSGYLFLLFFLVSFFFVLGFGMGNNS